MLYLLNRWIKMKKTKYLSGIVALSISSVVITGCTGNQRSNTAQSDWMNTDTVSGKVVHDDKGNEWVWHGGGGGFTNMLMGYWLINSLSSGMQTRYYPSSRNYTSDYNGASPIMQPNNVSSHPVKTREGVLSNAPTAAKPMSRSALKSGYAVSPNSMKAVTPSSSSSRSGFGRSGSRSFGS